MQGRLAVSRRDNAFNKSVWLGYLLGGSFIHLAVEAEHASVGAKGVAFIGFAKRLFERCTDGGAARIIVFDDHSRGLAELANQVQGAVEIQNIIEGEFLA